MEIVLSIASFAFATACSPGPNNIMLTASGVNYGFMRSLPHMAGVVVGFTTLLAVAASGLGALFLALPGAQIALKIVGGLYLLWLAYKVATAGQPQKAEDAAGKPLTFLQAAAFQAVNPKGLLMALSAAALFIHPETFLPDAARMLSIFSVATLTSVVIWAGFGTVVSRLLREPRHARIFNIAMALLLVASIVPILL